MAGERTKLRLIQGSGGISADMPRAEKSPDVWVSGEDSGDEYCYRDWEIDGVGFRFVIDEEGVEVFLLKPDGDLACSGARVSWRELGETAIGLRSRRSVLRNFLGEVLDRKTG